MCQLLGMNCKGSAAITFSFTGFAERGGRTAGHVDGWGIAFYDRSGCRAFHDDLPASESPLAAFLRSYPIRSRVMISHIRQATQGEVSVSNCHPFQREWLGQMWIFATNGDLRNFHPELDGPFLPAGSTDSEKAFCFLMQRLRAHFHDRRRPPSWQELAPVVAGAMAEVARFGNFNVLLSNGEALFAHCSSKLYALHRQHPFPHARLVDCDLSVDLGALNDPEDRMVLIATEPLTHQEPWVAFKTGEMKVFVDGELVWQHQDESTPVFPVATRSVGRTWGPAGAAVAPQLRPASAISAPPEAA